MKRLLFREGRRWIEFTSEGEWRVKLDGRGGLRRIGRLRTWQQLARSKPRRLRARPAVAPAEPTSSPRPREHRAAPHGCGGDGRDDGSGGDSGDGAGGGADPPPPPPRSRALFMGGVR